MARRRTQLAWMNVDDKEFVDWAMHYLSSRDWISQGQSDPAQAIRAFQTSFIARQSTDAAVNAVDEKLARNLKQAWSKHLKRKAAQGKQKPYSFEMDVRVHAKLRSIARRLGLPIYQTLTALILDAGKLQDEMRQQRKDEAALLKRKSSTQDEFAERKTKQIQALKAKVASWERHAERMAYDNAQYWIALKAAGLTSRDKGELLNPDQKIEAEALQRTLHAASMHEVKTSLGSLRLNLPHEPLTSTTTPPPEAVSSSPQNPAPPAPLPLQPPAPISHQPDVPAKPSSGAPPFLYSGGLNSPAPPEAPAPPEQDSWDQAEEEPFDAS